MSQLTVYTRDNCPNCIVLKNVLNAYSIEHTVKKIGVDITLQEFSNIAPGVREVPQVFKDGVRIGGLEDFKQYLSKNM